MQRICALPVDIKQNVFTRLKLRNRVRFGGPVIFVKDMRPFEEFAAFDHVMEFIN